VAAASGVLGRAPCAEAADVVACNPSQQHQRLRPVLQLQRCIERRDLPLGGEGELGHAQWIAAVARHPLAEIDRIRQQGTGLDDEGRSIDFPKLSVKVRDEIVSFGAPGELQVDESGVVGGGTRLSPEALHELVAERGDEVVFLDGRNALEAAIGRFRNAIVPPVETTRDFVGLLDSGAYDHLKGRPVVTYCTGGIRCEVLSSSGAVARDWGPRFRAAGSGRRPGCLRTPHPTS